MDRRSLTLVGLVLTLALFGCGASLEKKLVGRYAASFDQPAAAQSDPASQFARNFAQMLGGTTTLDLRDDKTFTMTLMAMPVEGKWSLEGNTLSLQAESLMGISPDQLRSEAAKNGRNLPSASEMEKPQRFTVDPSTLTLTSTEASPEGIKMVFKRKE